MSKKENFMRELRRFRRRWFPTTEEKAERRNFMKEVFRAAMDINYYVNILKKG